MSSKVMDEHLRRLLVLGEISALVETTRPRRVHEEVRRAVKLNHQATRSWWIVVRVWARLSRFECNVLNIREWEFDLVTSRIVVDVVGDASLVRRIEYHQIHCILAYTAPGANAERAAGKVVDDCCSLVLNSLRKQAGKKKTYQLCQSHWDRHS
jgi:hypothetical protein